MNKQLRRPIKYTPAKGHLFSKYLFGAFHSFQITNENSSTWGIIEVRSNSFVHFLEEFMAWQFAFEFYWPVLITHVEEWLVIFDLLFDKIFCMV